MRSSCNVLSVATVAGLLLSGCRASGQRSEHQDQPLGNQAHLPHADEGLGAFPGQIKTGFTREFGDAEIQDVEKRMHADGTVHWEVRYKDKAETIQTAEFDDKGNLVK